jgi:hypothetical protein
MRIKKKSRRRQRTSRHYSKTQRRLRGGAERPPRPIVCQCVGCGEQVEKGKVFCAAHTKGCPAKSPMTGWEPKWDPEVYNGDKAMQHSHNCFAYAMNVRDEKKIKKCREEEDCRFAVPGKTKSHPEFSGRLGKTCSDVIARTMADVPSAYLTDFQSKCEPKYSKIATVVDEENDFHYYRQDSNGWWSHKPGGRAATNVDAAGARIYNPELASRYYPKETESDTGLNYDSFCSYMCVPRDAPIQIAGAVATKKSKRPTRRASLRRLPTTL